jgi:TolA-binding protein
MVEDMQFWPSDSAPSALRKAIRWNGDAAVVGEAWYSLGAAFYKMVSTGATTRGFFYDSALVAYGELRTQYPNHVRFSDAAYRIGWVLYQKGSWLNAADTLKTYATDFPESALADGAMYWAAKSLGTAGKDCEAKSLMQLMLSNYPFTDKRVSAQAEILGWSCP